MTSVQIQSYAGVPIRSFDDWESHALPPPRKELHWKPDRSACELRQTRFVQCRRSIRRTIKRSMSEIPAKMLRHRVRTRVSARVGVLRIRRDASRRWYFLC